jgi:hypothetical protein
VRMMGRDLLAGKGILVGSALLLLESCSAGVGAH